MNLEIFRTKGIEGTISASPSKSYSHRAFFLSILQKFPIKLINPLSEGDVGKTINVCELLGAKLIEEKNENYEISSILVHPPKDLKFDLEKSPERNSIVYEPKTKLNFIDCGNSGTTIRILTALALIIEGKIRITGEFFRRNRPLEELLNAMKSIGAKVNIFYNQNKNESLAYGVEIEVEKVISNIIKIRGDISSQFITGLIIAVVGFSFRPDLKQKKGVNFDSFIIEITSKIKSYPYLLITKDICSSFGMEIKFENLPDNRLKIVIPIYNLEKNIKEYNIPGDFSSSAFIMGAAALYGTENGVIINNLDMNTQQGDKQIVNILKKMGAKIIVDFEKNRIKIIGRNKLFDDNGNYIPYLNGTEVDCSDIPDLFPILSTIGSLSNGTMILNSIEHIKLKESNRVLVMVRELSKLGINIKEIENSVYIYESQIKHLKNDLRFSSANHENDHRIIMSLIIFLIGILSNNNSAILENIEYINDSYPLFLKHLSQLKMNLNLIDK